MDAFTSLKTVMSFAPVLAVPDFSKPFVLEIDASDKGISTVLMQEHKPIAFLRRENKTVDALSRMNHGECVAITMIIPNWVTEVQKSYENDPELQSILQAKAVQFAAFPEYSLQVGIL
ncbi:hypothetical protein Sango_1016800 [Sesamum angolense]|uniref:Reverse transcriptase/retrotransposon-derived protein RNase H-like domain-containing protein n=1 Tax=Sesamum angolense TaxID=2727404 RepID=A0AAE1X0C5_9LAMI|nr:hypothetical protein Sango_1016800 [Sesamum angolense]